MNDSSRAGEPDRALAVGLRPGMHAAGVGLAAFALFCIQPLAARVLLPRLGGAPSVWNAVALFFQLALVAGYFLADRGARRLGTRRLLVAYAAACVLAAVWALSGQVRAGLSAAVPAVGSDTFTLFASTLGSCVLGLGIPALALTMSTPTWSRAFAARRTADPYPLYAASNLGSFVALLAYPSLLEPFLGVQIAFRIWAACLVLLALLALLSARAPLVGGLSSDENDASTGEDERARSRSWPWIARAALPSALLLAATTHLSTDLAPGPWLWVAPLAAYLLSYVLAFARRGGALRQGCVRLGPVIAASLVPLVMLEVTRPTLLVLGAHLLALFVLCTAHHAALAGARPGVSELTRYYLAISIGGALGAALVSFAVPLVMDRLIEYPLLLAAALLAWPRATRQEVGPPAGVGMLGVSALLVAAGMGLCFVGQGPSRPEGSLPAAAFALWVPLFWLSPRWPRSASRFLGVMGLVGLLAFELRTTALRVDRSFFSAYRVLEKEEVGLRWLAHGRTNHGAQSTAQELRGWALPYHHPRSPIATVFDAHPGAQIEFAVLGLGVGAMAAHLDEGQRMYFLEVDPLVEELARAHFSFLPACSACTVGIVDGRLGLEASRPGRFDAIVLDAFSSDAIPTHLLTREALEAYRRALVPGGHIAIHVSNRHIDLRGPLADLSAKLGTQAWFASYEPGNDPDLPQAARGVVAATRWVVLAHPNTPPPPAGAAFDWRVLPAGDPDRAWTDDSSSLLPALIAHSDHR